MAACVPPARRLPAVLPEVSGLAYLPDGRLLALNDGGHPGQVYALDLDAGTADAFGPLLTNVDWEALGHDPLAGWIIVCDVGDNARARGSVTVYPLDRRGHPSEARQLAYPDGPHDCEACLLRADTLTLITKARTLGGERERVAYVYQTVLGEGLGLALVDSFTLRRRSVTDAVYLTADTLAVLAYDFRILGILPFAKTSLYVGTLGDFRQNRQRRRRVRAPFTLTQYEALAYPGRGREVLLASERTVIWPQRWRRVRLP